MPGGHLDVIAEDGIVPDLERGDAGRLAVAAFEFGDGAAAVVRGRAEAVELGVVALGNEPALGRVERGRGDQSAAEFVDQGVVTAKVDLDTSPDPFPAGATAILIDATTQKAVAQPVAVTPPSSGSSTSETCCNTSALSSMT